MTVSTGNSDRGSRGQSSALPKQPPSSSSLDHMDTTQPRQSIPSLLNSPRSVHRSEPNHVPSALPLPSPSIAASQSTAYQNQASLGRSRSSSVSAAIKSALQRPMSSQGFFKHDTLDSPRGPVVKGRSRAGTFKDGSRLNVPTTTTTRGEFLHLESAETTPRASIYGSSSYLGSQHPPTNLPSYASSSQPHLAVPSSPSGSTDGSIFTNKRRLFGRSNSIRNMGNGAKSTLPDQHSKQPRTTSSGSNLGHAADGNTRAAGKGILRRMGSKSFFGIGSSKDAMRSSDTLSIQPTGTSKPLDRSSSTLGVARKLDGGGGQDDGDKSAQNSQVESLQPVSINEFGELSSSHVDLGRVSIDSYRSSISIISSETKPKMVSNREPSSDSHLTDGTASAHGFPKRLSGWLLNMMGGEASEAQGLSRATERPDRGGSPQTPLKPLESSKRSFRETSPPLSETGLSRSSTHCSQISSAPPSTHISRSKTGAVLQTFAGPTKNAKAANMASAGASGGGWGSAGVGLDRALKFFLDGDAASKTDEGIWLLGVWHGPSTVSETPTNQSTEQQTGHPPSIEILQASPKPQEKRGASRHVAGNSKTSPGPSTGRITPNPQCPSRISLRDRNEVETPQTPDSVSSSLPPSSPLLSTDDAFVVTMNPPPTPQSSPCHPKAKSAQAQPSSSANTIASASTTASLRSTSSSTSVQAQASSSNIPVMVADWQLTFHPDFSSRIWCTYRNHFAPIARDGSISELAANSAALVAQQAVAAATTTATGGGGGEGASFGDKLTANAQQSSSGRSWLGRKFVEANMGQDGNGPPALGFAAPFGASQSSSPSSSLGEKIGISNLWGRATAAAQAAGFSRAGLTTDAGWGCMLRTGQSLLANALLNVHLGRSWMREPAPLPQRHILEQMLATHRDDKPARDAAITEWRNARKRYAKYVRLLSWFLDDPSPACPFGVHRMAREGKRLGKEVGEWFGPSTAAGAIKQLVSEFPQAGIGVAVAHDGVFYLDEVRAAAVHRSSANGHAGGYGRRRASQVWQRPVLILIGIRLGLEGVNPMYYDSVKATFSFPQSVGIAGGRPSSSYYFMGYQGHSLFYLDPHHVRPAVPLRYPPSPFPPALPNNDDGDGDDDNDDRLPDWIQAEEDDKDEWWAHAYTDVQVATFHCDKIRRMPMKSLDPSMLLGFLCKDELSLLDLCSRIKNLPKVIFSFADSAPKWIDDDDFDPSMESFSESSVGEPEHDRDSDDDDEDGDGDEERQPPPLPSRSGSRSAENQSVEETAVELAKKTKALSLVGHGHPQQPSTSSGSGDDSHEDGSFSGIAFPSVEPFDKRPPRNDVRQASTSSALTTRPSTQKKLNLQRQPSSGSQTRTPTSINGDESFSTMNLSDTETWEEVSEGGTIAGSQPFESRAVPIRQTSLSHSNSAGIITRSGSSTVSLSPPILIDRPTVTDDPTSLSMPLPHIDPPPPRHRSRKQPITCRPASIPSLRFEDSEDDF